MSNAADARLEARRSVLAGDAPSPPRFTERGAHEHGFAAVFDAEIVPRLADLEAERRRRRSDYLWRLALVVLAVPLLVGAILHLGGMAYLGIVFFALVLSIAAAAWFLAQPKRGFRDATRNAVLPSVCRFLGGLQHARGRQADVGLSRFAESGVVGHYHRASLDDVFVGRYRNTAFMVAETTLRRRSGGRRRRNRTVFCGLLFSVEVPRSFPGRIMIGRNHGGLGNAVAGWLKKFDGLQRVELPHPRFEALYAAYSDDPAAARAWLTPDFLDSWVAVAESSKGSAIRAAFAGSAFLAALPGTRDLFESGSLSTPVDRIEDDLHRLLWEVTIPHRLIDFLHGDRHRTLV